MGLVLVLYEQYPHGCLALGLNELLPYIFRVELNASWHATKTFWQRG